MYLPNELTRALVLSSATGIYLSILVDLSIYTNPLELIPPTLVVLDPNYLKNFAFGGNSNIGISFLKLC